MRNYPFLALAMILLLAGCGGRMGAQEDFDRFILPEKPGGRLCAFQCRNAYEHCADQCNLGERACYQDTQAQAIKDYEAYARDQFMARARVELRPRDFERAGQCESNNCRKTCRDSYDKCFTSCGGKIERAN